MPQTNNGTKDLANPDNILDTFKDLTIRMGPSYANNFFFTLGVYLLELLGILIATGIIMVIFGPYWWNFTLPGAFIRSVHLWAAEAFVTLLFIHLLVNFATSAFKSRKLMWVIGCLMLFLVLLQFAFGVGIGGSLLAQVNEQAGSDLWNGMGLGYWINPMNAGAVYGWHVAAIPIILIFLIMMHYSIVRKNGLLTPYRKDIPYTMIEIDHKMMYRRMLYLLALVLVFAALFTAPYLPPLTISAAAKSNPSAVALAFLGEFNMSSPTATYLDTINPYTFNTRQVYVTMPYSTYLNITHSNNYEAMFLSESAHAQNAAMSEAYSYFNSNGSISAGINSSNPLIAMVSRLTYMAQVGAYQPILQAEATSESNTTYVIRFLYDTGILWNAGAEYGLSVPQWGMLSVGPFPWYLQYWLIPYNLLQIVTSNIPWWSDLENGSIALVSFLVLLLFPFIPFLRDLPDKLGLYKLFWNKYTIPEMRTKEPSKSKQPPK